MKRDKTVYLKHILESIHLISDYIKDSDEKNFKLSTSLQDQVIRRLEIIGEAVKYLPVEIKNHYPDIEWKKIAGLRDILIHQYFGINLDLIWNTVKTDIPRLKNQIDNLLKLMLNDPSLFDS